MDPRNAGYQDKVYQLLKGLGCIRSAKNVKLSAKNVKLVSKVKDCSGLWNAFEDSYVHGDLCLGEDVFVDHKFANIFNMCNLNIVL